MRKFLLFFIVLTLIIPFNFVKADDLANKLKGRILLQVESKGEAWYVNPDNLKRYYLGKPIDAFQVMRELGLGISNKDYDSFKGIAPKKLSGKILLKVEDNGQAYYVNPVNLKMYYLGRPADAFKAMRELGLGISNNNLNKILENGQIDASNLKVLSNSEIIEKLKPSVVYIETINGSGSGMIIESDGYILTNAHVVQGISSAKVIFSDNSELNTSIVGRDENIDLALLKVEKSNIKKVALGDSDTVKQGDEIFTLGYPFGIKGDVSFKEGTISRTLKSGDNNYLEISADIHPGNSGGPLVNKYGQVIGINTATIGESIKSISVGETIKLAIPVNIAKTLIPELKAGRNVVVERKEPEVSSPSEGTDAATDFAIKAQCSQLGQQKKAEDDSKYPLGGTTAYGYSPKLNTCIYGKLYLSELKSIDSLLFSGQIWNLLTGEQVYRTEPLMMKTNTSGAEADQFLAKQKEETAKLWAVYNSLVP